MSNKALLATIVTLSLCVAAPLPAQPPSSPAPKETPSLKPLETDQRTPAGSPAPGKGGTTTSQATDKQQDGGGGLFGGNSMLLFVMIGIIILMVVMSSRSRRKQEAKRKELLSGMKKGDRVTTIGGMIGTLIEVREHEVVVKVDEQNNTRLRFLKSAIAHVGETPAEKEQTKS
jgi:preprotein translocase subunit YajC